jgi:hypothetical protein
VTTKSRWVCWVVSGLVGAGASACGSARTNASDTSSGEVTNDPTTLPESSRPTTTGAGTATSGATSTPAGATETPTKETSEDETSGTGTQVSPTGGSASSSGASSPSSDDATSQPSSTQPDTGETMPEDSQDTGGESNSSEGYESTSDSTAACNPSEAVGQRAQGSGPHEVIIETNSDPGINEGTIFRPADLGGEEKYPIFVWGQGACSQDGMANAAAMKEIASHGYFVVADGTPNGEGGRTMDRNDLEGMAAPLMAYIDWAIEENAKPCSAYYHSLEPSMVGSNGFSCGGLMSQGTVLDPRIVTWGVNSSGMKGADSSFYDLIHTPVLFVEGGTGDSAYAGALEGYETITGLGVPVMWFDKALGHGGDLFDNDGGDFTRINLAWLNWWLKGDETVTGKGALVGDGCEFCSDPAWDVRSANLP